MGEGGFGRTKKQKAKTILEVNLVSQRNQQRSYQEADQEFEKTHGEAQETGGASIILVCNSVLSVWAAVRCVEESGASQMKYVTGMITLSFI
ncbi:hypothetical protein AMECASPLE_007303 [Ameca splendens]|uniref:Uncharacterized protein n=1 Tax=Ameca splendens TaxID=208324 RepID=A0ABV0YN12_9TELE